MQIGEFHERYRLFERAWLREFPRSHHDFNKAGAYADIMETALALHYIGHDGAAIVELCGWLERSCVAELAHRLGRDKTSRDRIYYLVERQGLVELSTTIAEMGLWTKKDLKFISWLNSVRNGVAHKNTRLLSKRLNAPLMYTHHRFVPANVGHLESKISDEPFGDTFARVTRLLITLETRRRRSKKRTA